MAFTDEQRQALRAKLRYRHVKLRSSNGASLSYVEGWHVIAEANRIFGYDCWDRQTLAPRCVWQEKQRGETACLYSTKVRITVRAGEVSIVREGIGTGMGRATSADSAHDIALKAAETDATKRALATFGNPFGLALYDKDRRGVTRQHERSSPRKSPQALLSAPTALLLQHADASVRRYDSPTEFVLAAVQCVQECVTGPALYAFWASNLEALAAASRSRLPNGEDPARVIGAAFKERLQVLAVASQSRNGDTAFSSTPSPPAGTATKSGSTPPNAAGSAAGAVSDPAASTPTSAPKMRDDDPGALLIPKDKRIRDKGHLAFVAGQPCLICGRRPAQAHHIRFAQSRALGLKVSDEFTVPLCNTHHSSLHQTGDERAWWARHGILDPIMLANRLWAASRQRPGHSVDASIPFDNEFDDQSAHPPMGSQRTPPSRP